MKTLKSLIAILIISFVITACPKPGIDGKATITGHVKHHEEHIPNAVVYIKYDATELPGTNASDFDDSTLASSGDGHYEFEELRKGNYYLFSTGYDSTIAQIVLGGIPVKITKKTETVEIDIPVTE